MAIATKLFGKREAPAAPAAPAAGSLERRTEIVELLSAAQSEGVRLEKARTEAAETHRRAKADLEAARLALANAEELLRDHVAKSAYAIQPLRAELQQTAAPAIGEAVALLEEQIAGHLKQQQHSRQGEVYRTNTESIVRHAAAARVAINELQNLRLQAFTDAEVAKQIKRITSKVPAVDLEVK